MSSFEDIFSFVKDLMDYTPEISLRRVFEKYYLEVSVCTESFEDYYYDCQDTGLIHRLKNKVQDLTNNRQIAFYLSDNEQNFLNDNVSFDNAKNDYLSYINRCSPDFFENVCTALLYFKRYESITKTSQSNDGGIDFFAKKILDNGINNGGVTEITILGQAKRYGKTQVGIGCIRDFLGATEIIRCGGYKEIPGEIKCPTVDYSFCKPFSAQARMFITSGSFSGNAKNFAEWLGMRMIDGNELAQIFHHHRLGFSRSETNVYFKKKKFRREIDQMIKEIELMKKM